ncbi:hypothetical protein F5880DRAFT_1506896 [Lentinula raphanica]|nr:hypothetical protein F5880DRAFT_1506896 [Lentinula raphanica]
MNSSSGSDNKIPVDETKSSDSSIEFFQEQKKRFTQEVDEIRRCAELERKSFDTREHNLTEYIILLEWHLDAGLEVDSTLRKEREEWRQERVELLQQHEEWKKERAELLKCLKVGEVE